MHLYIKNMVCNRCITAVRQELDSLNFKTISVNLGVAELVKEPTSIQLNVLNERLIKLGFELLDDQKHKLIENIKNLLIQKIQNNQVDENFSLGKFLSKALNKEYSSTSRLFSSVAGYTIEQFFILQKLEKVKEWLIYEEMTLSEISWRLGYSSVAHLSGQFKKLTGLNPSQFKKISGKRIPLDKV